MPITGPNQKFSWNELVSLAEQAGLSSAKAGIAAAIALAESGGNSGNLNPNAPDYSVGLWQINIRGSLGNNRPSEAALYDPLQNAQAMAKISGMGSNFGPWSTYTNGAYSQYLNGTNSPPGGGGVTPGLPPTGNTAAGTQNISLLNPLSSTFASDWRKVVFAAAGAGLIIMGAFLYFRHDIGTDLANAFSKIKPAVETGA